MVQLKSFKFVGDDAAASAVESAENSGEDLSETRNDEVTVLGGSINSTEATRSTGHLSSVSTSETSSSVSTVVGGNLTTATSESGSLAAAQSVNQEQPQEQELIGRTREQVPEQEVASNQSNASSSGTTSSNESQVAQIDIEDVDDDDDDDDDEVTKISIKDATATTSPQIPITAARRNFAKSPHAPLKSGQPRTPLLARAGAGITAQQQLDTLSEDSSRPQTAQPSNHFEIRWRNICLRAQRRSKVPNFITGSPLYKLFKKQGDPDGVHDKIYNSPPLMRHKLQLQQNIISTSPQQVRLDLSNAASVNQKVQQVSANSADSESGSSSSEYRPILANISGSVFSGQLTAVLGPSGVGKTTLLNSLTGRNTLDGTGRVSLLGNETAKRMSVVTVPQADVLPAKLTAIEDMHFTSRLRNPEKGFDHERNIGRIAHHLQMEKFLETRIDKLSGGEARRLSIGRELLGSPDIMILDEPTSGLDANTCKKIIFALRDIVEHSDNILDKPMSIIITIHQPQQEVLNIFHRVYVMALGGCAIYEGPASSLLSHLLEHSSLSKECQVEQLNENPAIVAIEVASGEYGTNVISELALHHEIQCANDDLYSYTDTDGSTFNSPFLTPRVLRGPRKSPLSHSPHGRRMRLNSDGTSSNPSIGKPTPIISSRLHHPKSALGADHLSSVTSLSSYDIDLPEPVSRLKVDKRLRRSVIMKGDFISHTLTLMSRNWLLTTRDTFLMVVRIVGFLLVAAGMVQIFAHALDPNEHQCPMYQSEVDDVLSFMDATKARLLNLQTMLKQASSTHTFFFHLGLCIFMVNAALSGLVFPLNMRMFLREYKNGWYSPASFITSNTLAELPIDMIGPIIVVAIVYPLCHQPASVYNWREIGYALVLIISCIIGKSQSQIIGAFLMNSVEMSVFISCVAVAPMAILSGIAVRVSQMTPLVKLASYLSWLRYCFELLFTLRYGAGICPCDPTVVSGYPAKPSLTAIPDQLDRMARGFLELNAVSSPRLNDTRLVPIATDWQPVDALDKYDSNLFVRYIRLVMDAGNLFAPKLSELGDCQNYRSLYLIDLGIYDNVLTNWVIVLLVYLIVARLLTYFVVRTVIKNARVG